MGAPGEGPLRNVTTLTPGEDAAALSLVLDGHRVAHELRPGDDGTELWIHDDARLSDARGLLAQWRADPSSAELRRAAEAGAQVRSATRATDQAWRRRTVAARRSIVGADGRGITMVIVAIASVVVAAVSGMGNDVQRIEPLFLTSNPPVFGLPELRAGQVWRLFTPAVVHFGVLHLMFNLSMWWRWAGPIEQRKGAGFFVPFVLASSAGTNLAQHVWNLITAPAALHLTGGLSGVLYAMFGYLLAKGRLDPADGLGVDDGTARLLIGWLFLCMTGLLGQVANAAHVSGLLIGLCWVPVEMQLHRWQRR